jgi:hypothetical protein
MNKEFKIWATLRDAVIVFLLQLLGGIVADSLANGTAIDQSSIPTMVILTKLGFGGIGFAISGCLAAGNRWRHLLYVAVVVFGFDIGYAGVSLQNCVVTVIFICLNVLIGGGLSFLLKRNSPEGEKLEQAQKSQSSGGSTSSNVVDDKFYDEVACEMQEKPLIAGLWTKAFAEMEGDDAKARALYIKYRVAQLMVANRKRIEEERAKYHWDSQESRGGLKDEKSLGDF